MILFKIIDSPDLLAIGEYNFNLHHITIGRSHGQTLAINDDSLLKKHLTLKTTESKLIINCDEDFLINNKRAKGTLNLKIGDVIKVGQSQIQILNFNFEHSLNPNSYYEALEEIGNTDPQLLMLIEKLELLYIDLTGE